MAEAARLERLVDRCMDVLPDDQIVEGAAICGFGSHA